MQSLSLCLHRNESVFLRLGRPPIHQECGFVVPESLSRGQIHSQCVDYLVIGLGIRPRRSSGGEGQRGNRTQGIRCGTNSAIDRVGRQLLRGLPTVARPSFLDNVRRGSSFTVVKLMRSGRVSGTIAKTWRRNRT